MSSKCECREGIPDYALPKHGHTKFCPHNPGSAKEDKPCTRGESDTELHYNGMSVFCPVHGESAQKISESMFKEHLDKVTPKNSDTSQWISLLGAKLRNDIDREMILYGFVAFNKDGLIKDAGKKMKPPKN